MAFRFLSNKASGKTQVHITSTSNINVAGNSSQSDIALSTETLTGATIRRVVWGTDVDAPHRAVTRAPLQSLFKGNLANVEVLRAQCPLPETSFELKCVAQSLGVPKSQIQVREKATP